MDQDPLFLSQEELQYFTGAIHRNLVCTHLEMRGISYDLNRNLEVLVLRDEIRRFLSGNSGPPSGGPKGGGSRGKKLNF